MARTVSKNGEGYVAYKNFGGMDVIESADKRGKVSFAYAENMYRDYEGDFSGSVESIPGFRTLANFRSAVNSVFMQKCSEDEEYIVVHAGTSLFRFNIKDRDALQYQNAIATLANTESHAFQIGNSLYVCDGAKITKIHSSGQISTVGSEDGTVYIPTLFKNGLPYEQRNLLTRKYKELFVLDEHEKYYRRSYGLKYEITGNDSCKVVGVDDNHEGALYIPKYAKLGDKYFKITAIADLAFSNNEKITEVFIADGLTVIGKLAFSGCLSLTSIHCPTTIELIDNGAFLDCGSLTDVFIGKNLKSFGDAPFAGAYLLETLKFEAEYVVVAGLVGFDGVNSLHHEYSVPKPDKHYGIPVFTVYESIVSVKLDGTDIGFEGSEGGPQAYIFFSLSADIIPEGVSALISFIGTPGDFNLYEEGWDFISRSGGDENVIAECRSSAYFDGRIFVAGNPKYPNTVFYSLKGRNPSEDCLYFGSLSYFDDGMSAYKTVSLTPVGDSLAVLKARDDGGGGIFCHESRDGGDFLEKLYPVSNIHTGINVKSGAVSHFDEMFFLSDIGACTLEKRVGDNRSLLVKSEKINPLLLKGKDLSAAHITSWQGYLVIQLEDEIYLADARGKASSSSGEFDWYLINNVGTYKGAKTKCFYSEFAPEGLSVHPTPTLAAGGQIYLLNEDTYGGFYYVRDGSKSYAVYITEEKEGGTYSAASTVFSDGRLLFFGTKNGDLCLFNTDKRGIAPARIKAMADFDEEEYSRVMGNRIHPAFYHFAGRAPRYSVVTKLDDVGIPYFKKNLIPGSLCLELGSMGSSDTVCEIYSDGGCKSQAHGFCDKSLNFYELDFSALSFDTEKESSVAVKDGPKSFRELKIAISSDSFCSPISISGISFRYKIKGRLTRK